MSQLHSPVVQPHRGPARRGASILRRRRLRLRRRRRRLRRRVASRLLCQRSRPPHRQRDAEGHLSGGNRVVAVDVARDDPLVGSGPLQQKYVTLKVQMSKVGTYHMKHKHNGSR
jgi:hypothetical protein